MADPFKEKSTNINKCSEMQKNNSKITVCVRKKPIESTRDIILLESNSITVQNHKVSYSMDDILYSHKFQFDKVYSEKSSNTEIFKDSIENLVDHTLNGGCSSVIAYGQTGTGKTYSLLNPFNGIIFESIRHILKKGFRGSISFLEIYLGNVQDCLKNKSKLNIFERDGVIYASELTSKPFTSFEEASELIAEGLKNRTTSPTEANSYSSRSHAVLFIDCYKENFKSFEGIRQLASNSTFILIDLAGSERGNDRKNCSKEAAAEGAEINKSLLALKECIRGIELNSKFLPFRQSKLTQLLKNSFIGESKLFFLATISASAKDSEHTLNTLRYAIRIKESRFYSNGSSEEELKLSDEDKFNGEQVKIEKIVKENHRSQDITDNKPKNEILKIKKSNEEKINVSPRAAYSILTSDEINRLKDLSINETSSSTDKSILRKYTEEINRLADMQKDSVLFKEILKDLEEIIFRLKNIKNI